MEKVIRDGKVAVLYSPDFGAGWSTWGAPEAAIFHPTLVKLVEERRRNEITDKLLEELFGMDFYTGGARDLVIKWVPVGTAFTVEEYDSNESIKYLDNIKVVVA